MPTKTILMFLQIQCASTCGRMVVPRTHHHDKEPTQAGKPEATHTMHAWVEMGSASFYLPAARESSCSLQLWNGSERQITHETPDRGAQEQALSTRPPPHPQVWVGGPCGTRPPDITSHLPYSTIPQKPPRRSHSLACRAGQVSVVSAFAGIV